MNRYHRRCVITITLHFIVLVSLKPQTVNQTDNFQDGTVMSWTSGSNNPTQPVSVSTGGPAGTGDKYLRAVSAGGSGAGSKLVFFNQNQWLGNYISANITSISMHMKNEGANALSIRIALIGTGGSCITASVSVPVGSGWVTASYSLAQANVTVSGTYSTVMGNITELRILHNTSASTSGQPIAAQLGIDDITAAAGPLPVELTSFTARVENNGIGLYWETATETNNAGFEIERKVLGDWKRVGFVDGAGTSNAPRSYYLLDEDKFVGIYSYRLKQIDRNGLFTYSHEVTVDVEDNNALKNFELKQNYPNPFNPATEISFSLEKDGMTTLTIYNAIGQKVTTLVHEELKSGVIHHRIFNGEKLASGMYFTCLQSGVQMQIMRMLLIK